MKKLAFLMLVLLSLFKVAQADNMMFLDYSPMSYFQGNDEKIMVANTMSALNNYGDGKKVSWKNPATGAWGFAIPSNTISKNGLRCRNLKIFTNAKGVTGEVNYQFCKFGDTWKVTG